MVERDGVCLSLRGVGKTYEIAGPDGSVRELPLHAAVPRSEAAALAAVPDGPLALLRSALPGR